MRILCLCREKYPVESWASYVYFNQALALEELGHEFHQFVPTRSPLGLADYLGAYGFDLLYIDAGWLASKDVLRTLQAYRRRAPVRAVAALLDLPGPPEEAWEVVDFAVTPWQGRVVESLRRTVDVRSLPLGYSARFHRRVSGLQPLPPVYVGNTGGERSEEAASWLDDLRREGSLLCIGPAFERKRVDPFSLGRVYSAARCVPNFHYASCRGDDRILNERFWQSAACGIPVTDSNPLAPGVFDAVLLKSFCFDNRAEWQDRVRKLASGRDPVEPAILARLDTAIRGHSYLDRMTRLLDWLD